VSPRTRWHLLNYGPAVMLATMTAPALAMGESPFSAFVVLLAATTTAIQSWSFRSRYKTGWHHGRVDMARLFAGDPDAAMGSRAPEPWAPRRYEMVGVHRHDDDTEGTTP
jgi:hypothetical protein